MGSGFDVFRSEVLHAVRGLARAPGFTATVVVTLALGIGANAAMFDVVDRLMFRPLPYLRDPDSVHRIYWQWQDRGTTVSRLSTEYTRYLDLERHTTSFSHLAAFSERPLPVGTGETRQERRVGAVSASFFDFFDAPPALGRYFRADEDVTPRGADVAVLSWGFWQAAYGGRDVLGEAIVVGTVRATIVGVAPRGFHGVDDADPPSVFVPITTFAGSTGTGDAATYFTRYQWGWVHVLARRAPGVAVERAEADATAAFRLSWEAGRADQPRSAPLEQASPAVAVSAVRPGAGPDPSLEARTARWIALVALFVLVIACANIANLFLMRGVRAHRETAVRLALGAGRVRLMVRPLLESTLLVVAGGAAALLVAYWAGAAIRRLLLGRSDAAGLVIFDGRTLVFTLVLTALVGVALGCIPAVLSGRGDLSGVIRGGARGGSTGGRLRTSLLVVQLTLSAVLLVGAALFVRSLHAVRDMRMGYDVDRVVRISRIIEPGAFEDNIQIPLRRQLLAAAQSHPAVEAAAWVHSAPFLSTSSTELFVVGIDSVGLLGDFTYQATTPDYFRTMRTRILRGRGIEATDRTGAPTVAVVSESMARTLWPGRDALGHCFRMRQPDAVCITVVGVAEDIVQRSIEEQDRYHYYLALEQHAAQWWGNGMMVRLRGGTAVVEDLRTALQREVPGAYWLKTESLEEVVDRERRSWRLGAGMFTAFGVLALFVAGVGLSGAIAYDLAQRMHELGVRVALGASRAALLWLVLRRTLAWTLAGLCAGTTIAVFAARWIQPLLFGQSATDLRVYAGVALALLGIALAAGAAPALRAARTDPARVLRAE